MKKARIALVVLLLCLLATLTSCVSSVQVSGLVPSEINMGKYRNLAVASTKSFTINKLDKPSNWVKLMGAGNATIASGVPADVESQVATYATDKLVKTLTSTGFFNLTLPSVTDVYVASGTVGMDTFALLKQAGANALMTSAISYMNCEEYLYSKPQMKWIPDAYIINSKGETEFYPGHEEQVFINGVAQYNYYLVQSATVTFTYTIFDTENGAVLATRSFSDKVSKENLLESNSGFATSILPVFRNMIDGFQVSIAKQLAPSKVTRTLYLMENKPKNDAAKEAYKQVDSGNLMTAYQMFLNQWVSNRHVPSGYNAALLLEAMGDLGGGVNLMQEVYNTTYNKEVSGMLARMQSTYQQNLKAQEQMNGGSKPQEQKTDSGQLVVMQVFTGE